MLPQSLTRIGITDEGRKALKANRWRIWRQLIRCRLGHHGERTITFVGEDPICPWCWRIV